MSTLEAKPRARAEAAGVDGETYLEQIAQNDENAAGELESLASAGWNSGAPVTIGASYSDEKHRHPEFDRIPLSKFIRKPPPQKRFRPSPGPSATIKLESQVREIVHTVNLTAEISASRELRITLPADIPAGPAQILLEVTSPSEPIPSTAISDLLESEFFGIWRDRTGIADNAVFAANLRSVAWNRSRE